MGQCSSESSDKFKLPPSIMGFSHQQQPQHQIYPCESSSQQKIPTTTNYQTSIIGYAHQQQPLHNQQQQQQMCGVLQSPIMHVQQSSLMYQFPQQQNPIMYQQQQQLPYNIQMQDQQHQHNWVAPKVSKKQIKELYISLFNQFDTNYSGQLELEQFFEAICALFAILNHPPPSMRQMMKLLLEYGNEDGDSVSRKQFKHVVHDVCGLFDADRKQYKINKHNKGHYAKSKY